MSSPIDWQSTSFFDKMFDTPVPVLRACSYVRCVRYHFHSCPICPSSITRHSQDCDRRQVRHVQGHRRESRSFMETMTLGLWWNGRNHVFEDVIRCERVWWGESVGMRGMRCRRVLMVVVFGIWWLSVGRGSYHRHYNRWWWWWWLYPFLCLLLLLLSKFLVLRVVSTRREEHLKAYWSCIMTALCFDSWPVLAGPGCRYHVSWQKSSGR